MGSEPLARHTRTWGSGPRRILLLQDPALLVADAGRAEVLRVMVEPCGRQ